jgi:guanine deaminase
MGKELFVGTFVHSLSIAELEVGEKSVIGVEDGKIAFVEKNVTDLEAVKSAHKFEDAKVLFSLFELTGCR